MVADQTSDDRKKRERRKHVAADGTPLRCCTPNLKPHERYPLHAEWALRVHGMTAEEYDVAHGGRGGP